MIGDVWLLLVFCPRYYIASERLKLQAEVLVIVKVGKLMVAELESDFRLDFIRDGGWEQALPELYKLRGVIEHNDWHDNQSVFDHTLAVIDELDQLLEFRWIEDGETCTKWKRYIDVIIDSNPRRSILRVAALTHDFAKYGTIVRDANGITSCPGHENLSAEYLLDNADRFGLTALEGSLCASIIREHAEPDKVHNSTIGLGRKERSSAIRTLHETTRHYWDDLVLLALADTLANQLVSSQPQRYHSQVDFFLRCLGGLTRWDFDLE